ncbi:hypothetical protein [Paenibacillus segetis]|uniref:Extracellular solute-binding protein n=1 Tax=Paenibacillus segetis TaxID=1325360 RepID=A0ABQ1Y4U4_9BACL|nr:hypothetical protein [Paenibacillus segetis]GGH11954.1 hypothetical protein GCM10008013_04090 [Paenibacillus segetis]
MKGKQWGTLIGIIILVFVVGIGYLFSRNSDLTSGGKGNITVVGNLGGEKIGLFSDEEIIKILKDRYHITVDWRKAGSIEMVKDYKQGPDFLFPSNQVALELFKNNHAEEIKGSEIIFNSPIVFYTWNRIADALIDQGIARQNNGVNTVDTESLLALVNEGKSWDDIGANKNDPNSKLYGKVTIISTDPSKSNSGNMFAGLYANLISGGVVNDSNIAAALPQIKAFFQNLGYLEPSSGDLFEQYLKTGMGAKPIIVGYENQMIEFAEDNPAVWEQVKDRMRVLYPVPTVWSSHPLIALSDNGKKLIEALKDKEIQELAWKKHGFRSGIVDIQNDVSALGIGNIPETIDSVIAMPTPAIMDQIIQAVQ